ncbi:DUF2399 domain-containing protein [Streptomyces sp. NPDC059398]|uniref:DUF2399 domain-containing protein n=1 Tax=Streptomyces sp. NPDC059398 TaxID=3346820 RepID=UPI0036A7F874
MTISGRLRAPRSVRPVSITVASWSASSSCRRPSFSSARTRWSRSPLVCTSGSAATVVLTLLDALASGDCRFAYHGARPRRRANRGRRAGGTP